MRLVFFTTLSAMTNRVINKGKYVFNFHFKLLTSLPKSHHFMQILRIVDLSATDHRLNLADIADIF